MEGNGTDKTIGEENSRSIDPLAANTSAVGREAESKTQSCQMKESDAAENKSFIPQQSKKGSQKRLNYLGDDKVHNQSSKNSLQKKTNAGKQFNKGSGKYEHSLNNSEVQKHKNEVKEQPSEVKVKLGNEQWKTTGKDTKLTGSVTKVSSKVDTGNSSEFPKTHKHQLKSKTDGAERQSETVGHKIIPRERKPLERVIKSQVEVGLNRTDDPKVHKNQLKPKNETKERCELGDDECEPIATEKPKRKTTVQVGVYRTEDSKVHKNEMKPRNKIRESTSEVKEKPTEEQPKPTGKEAKPLEQSAKTMQNVEINTSDLSMKQTNKQKRKNKGKEPPIEAKVSLANELLKTLGNEKITEPIEKAKVKAVHSTEIPKIHSDQLKQGKSKTITAQENKATTNPPKQAPTEPKFRLPRNAEMVPAPPVEYDELPRNEIPKKKQLPLQSKGEISSQINAKAVKTDGKINEPQKEQVSPSKSFPRAASPLGVLQKISMIGKSEPKEHLIKQATQPPQLVDLKRNKRTPQQGAGSVTAQVVNKVSQRALKRQKRTQQLQLEIIEQAAKEKHQFLPIAIVEKASNTDDKRNRKENSTVITSQIDNKEPKKQNAEAPKNILDTVTKADYAYALDNSTKHQPVPFIEPVVITKPLFNDKAPLPLQATGVTDKKPTFALNELNQLHNMSSKVEQATVEIPHLEILQGPNADKRLTIPDPATVLISKPKEGKKSQFELGQVAPLKDTNVSSTKVENIAPKQPEPVKMKMQWEGPQKPVKQEQFGVESRPNPQLSIKQPVEPLKLEFSDILETQVVHTDAPKNCRMIQLTPKPKEKEQTYISKARERGFEKDSALKTIRDSSVKEEVVKKTIILPEIAAEQNVISASDRKQVTEILAKVNNDSVARNAPLHAVKPSENHENGCKLTTQQPTFKEDLKKTDVDFKESPGKVSPQPYALTECGWQPEPVYEAGRKATKALEGVKDMLKEAEGTLKTLSLTTEKMEKLQTAEQNAPKFVSELETKDTSEKIVTEKVPPCSQVHVLKKEVSSVEPLEDRKGSLAMKAEISKQNQVETLVQTSNLEKPVLEERLQIINEEIDHATNQLVKKLREKTDICNQELRGNTNTAIESVMVNKPAEIKSSKSVNETQNKTEINSGSRLTGKPPLHNIPKDGLVLNTTKAETELYIAAHQIQPNHESMWGRISFEPESPQLDVFLQQSAVANTKPEPHLDVLLREAVVANTKPESPQLEVLLQQAEEANTKPESTQLEVLLQQTAVNNTKAESPQLEVLLQQAEVANTKPLTPHLDVLLREAVVANTIADKLTEDIQVEVLKQGVYETNNNTVRVENTTEHEKPHLEELPPSVGQKLNYTNIPIPFYAEPQETLPSYTSNEHNADNNEVQRHEVSLRPSYLSAYNQLLGVPSKQLQEGHTEILEQPDYLTLHDEARELDPLLQPPEMSYLSGHELKETQELEETLTSKTYRLTYKSMLGYPAEQNDLMKITGNPQDAIECGHSNMLEYQQVEGHNGAQTISVSTMEPDKVLRMTPKKMEYNTTRQYAAEPQRGGQVGGQGSGQTGGQRGGHIGGQGSGQKGGSRGGKSGGLGGITGGGQGGSDVPPEDRPLFTVHIPSSDLERHNVEATITVQVINQVESNVDKTQTLPESFVSQTSLENQQHFNKILSGPHCEPNDVLNNPQQPVGTNALNDNRNQFRLPDQSLGVIDNVNPRSVKEDQSLATDQRYIKVDIWDSPGKKPTVTVFEADKVTNAAQVAQPIGTSVTRHANEPVEVEAATYAHLQPSPVSDTRTNNTTPAQELSKAQSMAVKNAPLAQQALQIANQRNETVIPTQVVSQPRPVEPINQTPVISNEAQLGLKNAPLAQQAPQIVNKRNATVIPTQVVSQPRPVEPVNQTPVIRNEAQLELKQEACNQVAQAKTIQEMSLSALQEPTMVIPKQVIDAITQLVNSSVDVLQKSKMMETSKQVAENLQVASSKVAQDIQAKIPKVAQDVQTASSKVAQNIQIASSKVAQDIQTTSSKVAQDIKTASSKVAQDIQTTIPKVTQEIRNAIQTKGGLDPKLTADTLEVGSLPSSLQASDSKAKEQTIQYLSKVIEDLKRTDNNSTATPGPPSEVIPQQRAKVIQIPVIKKLKKVDVAAVENATALKKTLSQTAYVAAVSKEAGENPANKATTRFIIRDVKKANIPQQELQEPKAANTTTQVADSKPTIVDTTKRTLHSQTKIDEPADVSQEAKRTDAAPKQEVQAPKQIDTQKPLLQNLNKADTPVLISSEPIFPKITQIIPPAHIVDTPNPITEELSKVDAPKQILQELNKINARKAPNIQDMYKFKHTFPEPNIDAPKQIIQDLNKVDAPKQILQDLYRVDAPKQILQDLNKVDASKQILKDLNKVDASKQIIQDLNKVDDPKQILQDLNKVHDPKLILQNLNKVHDPKPILPDVNKVDAPKPIIKEPKADAPKEVLKESKTLDAPTQILQDLKPKLQDVNKVDVPKPIIQESKAEAPKEVLKESKTLDASKELTEESDTVDTRQYVSTEQEKVNAIKQQLEEQKKAATLNVIKANSAISQPKPLVEDRAKPSIPIVTSTNLRNAEPVQNVIIPDSMKTGVSGKDNAASVNLNKALKEDGSVNTQKLQNDTNKVKDLRKILKDAKSENTIKAAAKVLSTDEYVKAGPTQTEKQSPEGRERVHESEISANAKDVSKQIVKDVGKKISEQSEQFLTRVEELKQVVKERSILSANKEIEIPAQIRTAADNVTKITDLEQVRVNETEGVTREIGKIAKAAADSNQANKRQSSSKPIAEILEDVKSTSLPANNASKKIDALKPSLKLTKSKVQTVTSPVRKPAIKGPNATTAAKKLKGPVIASSGPKSGFNVAKAQLSIKEQVLEQGVSHFFTKPPKSASANPNYLHMDKPLHQQNQRPFSAGTNPLDVTRSLRAASAAGTAQPPTTTAGRPGAAAADGEGGSGKPPAQPHVEAEPEDPMRRGEPPLTGLAKHFNSSTIRGRANVAKATFALLGLYTLYKIVKPSS